MTPYALLSRLAGLSTREAAEHFRVSRDTVKSWAAGRRNPPGRVIDKLRDLIARQAKAADAMLIGLGDDGEIGCPGNDAEARILGWPCLGAWAMMAARVLARADREVATLRERERVGGSCDGQSGDQKAAPSAPDAPTAYSDDTDYSGLTMPEILDRSAREWERRHAMEGLGMMFDITRQCCFCGADNSAQPRGYAGERQCRECGKGGETKGPP